MATPLIPLIEEFQQHMTDLVNLVEETQADSKTLIDLPPTEMLSKTDALLEICAEGTKKLTEASLIIEQIRQTLG